MCCMLEKRDSQCIHANSHKEWLLLNGGIIGIMFTFSLCAFPLYFPNFLQSNMHCFHNKKKITILQAPIIIELYMESVRPQ